MYLSIQKIDRNLIEWIDSLNGSIHNFNVKL